MKNSFKYKSFKCWICSNDTHWVDNCFKLKDMSKPEDLNYSKINGHVLVV